MGLKETFGKMIGIEEVDEEFSQEEIDKAKQAALKEEAPASRDSRPQIGGSFAPKQAGQDGKPQERRTSMAGTSTFTLLVIEPKSFDECPKLVDSLKARRPVVINLEKIETETAKKIFDFLSGATYALNGNVQKIASNIFIFAPEKVDITTTSSQERAGFDFGANKSPWAR